MRRFLFLVALMSLWSVPFAHAETVLFIAHSNKNEKSDNPTAAMAVTFKEIVEAKTGGAIKVEIFPENQLGTDAQSVALVKKGVIQMAISSVSGIVREYPLMAAMDFPFAYRRVEEAYALFDGPFGQKVRADIEAKTGIAVLGWGDTGGLFVLTNSKRPVRTPQDMEGLRIRTLGAKSHDVFVRSMKAESVVIRWDHLFDSLLTGLVDGQMNSVATTLYGRLNVVQRYMTLTNHAYVPFLWTANRDFLNELPPEQQAVVAEAVDAGIKASRAMAITSSGAELGNLMPSVKIQYLTDEERKAFADLAQEPVRQYVKTALGDEGLQFQEDFLAAVAIARAQTPEPVKPDPIKPELAKSGSLKH